MAANSGPFNTHRPACWLGLAAVIALTLTVVAWLAGFVQQNKEELQQAVEQLGTERSLTVGVYANRP
jgi:hypothetical protein